MKDKKKSNPLFWSGVERFITQFVQFSIGIYLARILLPSDFGLIGMLSLFIGVGEIISDGGFFRALVQKSEISDKEYSSVFWINLIISLIVFIFLIFLSPFVASFYSEPNLEILLIALSFNVIIKSLSIVQRAKLTISLNFRSLSYISLISVIVSGSLAIFLAQKGYGVWSLVCQIVIRNLLFLIASIFWIKWRPRFIIDIKSIIQLFKYGSNLLIVGIIDVFFVNIYNVLIGRYYSKSELGYYNRAQQFNDIISINLTAVIQRVAFSSMSKIKNDKDQFLKEYRSYLRMGNFMIVPIAFMLMALAEPIVVGILSDKWIQSVKYLELLSIIGIFYFINSLSITFLNAKGFSREFLKIEIFKKLLITISLFLTYQHGIESIILGQIIVAVISLYLNTYYNYKFTKYTFISLVIDTLPTILIGAMSFIIVKYTNRIIEGNFLEIVLGGIVGFLSYFLIANLSKVDEAKKINKYIYRLLNE